LRVLIVDDDHDFRRVLELALEADGLETETAGDGAAALEVLEKRPPGHFDLILLDVQMPGTSGWDLLYQLREAGDEIPVIYVSGLDQTEHKVKGLGLGADDYLSKPVDVDELKARLEAVVRRRQSIEPLRYGELTMDLARRKVTRGEAGIDLSPREFDLLLTLVRAKGGIVSRAELLSEVWDMDFDPGTNVLDVHIGRLRRKVDRTGRPLILNERGKGYHIAAHED